MIETIINNLYAQLAIALPDFTKAPIVYGVEKAGRTKMDKTYAVKPAAAIQTEGNLGAYTMAQTFEITLIDSYGSSKLVKDADTQSKVIALQDLTHAAYKQILSSSPAGVIRNITNLSSEAPELDTDNHLIIQNFTIDIIYQNRNK